jgi:putative PIN family toxin of toxin-antitoxin system
MIVTFDASILVRSTKRSTGPARRLIDALAAHADHVIALSPFILGEVGKVLSYPRMQALFGLTADEIRGHVDYLSTISRIVEPQVGLPVVLLDPNDDAVVYTAIAAGADVLCVRDRHFYDAHVVAFCGREDIRVMDELALLTLLG